MGHSATGGAHAYAAATTVTYTGTVAAWPVLEVRGPGWLHAIRNATTGQEILFKLWLNAEEVLTVDLTPGQKRVYSNWRSNLLGHVRPGSALATWGLVPAPQAASGQNVVTVFITSASGSTAVSLKYYPRYWSAEEAVG